MIMERCMQTEIFLIVNQRTVSPAVVARENGVWMGGNYTVISGQKYDT